MRLELSAGQAGDAPMATKLLDVIAPGTVVLADKAYDTNAIRAFAADRGAWPNIPPRSMRNGTFSFSKWV